MSNLIEHAKRELGLYGDTFYGDMLNDAVLELIEKFAEQGHSWMSASVCIAMFSRLAAFEPLGPLTGEASEWNEVAEGVYQNNRCSHVFKQPDRFDGQAYDIEGRVFRQPNGCCFTSGDSFVPVEFPYSPKREYVDVDENGEVR